MIRYVLGFLFSRERDRQVVLIQKERPTAQAGRLNGLGGVLAPGLEPQEAMQLKATEQIGVEVRRWMQYAVIAGHGWECLCFYAFAQAEQFETARTCTDEAVSKVRVDALPDNVLSDVRWLIPLALDPRPKVYAQVNYYPPDHIGDADLGR